MKQPQYGGSENLSDLNVIYALFQQFWRYFNKPTFVSFIDMCSYGGSVFRLKKQCNGTYMCNVVGIFAQGICQ